MGHEVSHLGFVLKRLAQFVFFINWSNFSSWAVAPETCLRKRKIRQSDAKLPGGRLPLAARFLQRLSPDEPCIAHFGAIAERGGGHAVEPGQNYVISAAAMWRAVPSSRPHSIWSAKRGYRMKGAGLELAAVTKRYGDTVAVDAIDLKVPEDQGRHLLLPARPVRLRQDLNLAHDCRA
jgi:hypothetical protein